MELNDLLTQLPSIRNEEKGMGKFHELFETDHTNSKPFAPAIKLKDKYSDIVFNVLGVPEESFAELSLVDWANDWCRAIRRDQYRKKIRGGYNGLKIVSEGDSWFQYPCTLRDIIDKIKDEYAVLSLGAAGDTMSKMLKKKEYMHHIGAEDSDVFLFSGGGNDVLGNGRVDLLLHEYDPERKPEDYPNQYFDEVIEYLKRKYRSLIQQVSGEYPKVHIFIHGYDYSLPNDGYFLGKPMARNGIVDRELQRKIVRVMLDRFNSILERFSKEREKVCHIDCRDCVPRNKWHDELHPNSHGFSPVAAKFREKLEEISELP